MRPTRTAPSLRGTTLRLGARGERVRNLQLHLHKLGYDPGPVDGLYGHLTYAAIREFQQDLRLTADGIAGHRVLAALSDDTLTHVQRRIVLAEIHSSTSPGLAARLLQRHAASLSGLALPVPVELTEEAQPEPSQQPPSPLDGSVPSRQLRCEETSCGELSSSDPLAVAQKHGLAVWHTLHTRGEQGGHQYQPGHLQRVLHNASGRHQLERQAVRLLAAEPGGTLYLDFGQITWGDGARLLKMMRKLGRHAERHGCELVVSVPLHIGRRGWTHLFEVLDPGALAALATRIILVPPLSIPTARPRKFRPSPSADPGHASAARPSDWEQSHPYAIAHRPPSPDQLNSAIREVAKDVPPWRCLLMVPLGAVRLSVDGVHPVEVLPYRQAQALAYTHRTRPRWDETIRRPMYHYAENGSPVTVWLENRDSIVYKLALVERWRLAGVYLSAVGLEDARIWTIVRDRWQVYKQSGG